MSATDAPPPAARAPEVEGARPRVAGGRARAAAAVAALALLGLFAYSTSFRGAFVYDDLRHIPNDPLIRDLGNFVGSWRGYQARPTRYLAYLSFALNYRLGGLDVFGYHVVNLAVHVGCAALLLALVVLLFRTPRMTGSAVAPHALAVGWAAAALFVTHPLQTQAVSYVVQRITSLATLLYLLAVVLYLRWRLARRERPGARARAVALYLGALAAALAATRTKEIAFTLPFALALCEACFFDRGSRRWVAVAPFLAVSLLVPLALVSVHQPLGAVIAEAAERTRVQVSLSRLDYLRTQATVVVRYLALLVLPVGQNVDPDVPVRHAFLEPAVLGSLALLGGLAGGALLLLRRAKPLPGRRPLDPAVRIVAFGVLWFFLTLSVESSVIPIVDLMNEHRVYLPSAGLLAGAATGGALLLRRVPRSDPGRLVALAAILLALPLASATLRRNLVWRDEIALWSDAAAKSPAKARPFYNLGSALAAAGRPEEALAALERAVRLDPSLAPARAQLGAALLRLGHLAEAEPELREAIRLDPAAPEPLFNLATLLARTHRASESTELFRTFLEVAPPSYEAARRLAAARVAAGPR